jgi:hypothetical protein
MSRSQGLPTLNRAAPKVELGGLASGQHEILTRAILSPVMT